jgi:hypothetical protein
MQCHRGLTFVSEGGLRRLGLDGTLANAPRPRLRHSVKQDPADPQRARAPRRSRAFCYAAKLLRGGDVQAYC